jgi:hypothetical protein
MSRYLYLSGELQLLRMLREGPVLSQDIAHLHGAPDRVCTLNKRLRGTGLRIVASWVAVPTRFGRTRQRRYRLVSDHH